MEDVNDDIAKIKISTLISKHCCIQASWNYVYCFYKVPIRIYLSAEEYMYLASEPNVYKVLCFRHLSGSLFCLALYTEEVNLQNFVMI